MKNPSLIMVSQGVGCGGEGHCGGDGVGSGGVEYSGRCTKVLSMTARFCETCASSVPFSKIMFSVVMICYSPHCSVCVSGPGNAHTRTHAHARTRTHTRALTGRL